MARHKLRALTFAVVLVTSMVAGGLGGVGTVAAQDDGGAQVNTCNDPVSQAAGAIVGFVTGGGFEGTATADNPCIKSENIADADTTAEAKRIISQEALEDRRYFETYETQFNTYSDNLQNPAYSDARVTFVEAVANGSDRVSAVTEARRAAHARTSSQQRELWVYYSSMANAIGTLETKAEDKGIRNESVRIGKFDSGGKFVDGYSFQGNATTNVTVTNGSKISVPAAVNQTNSSDLIHPRNDDLLVQVYNPETKEWFNLLNEGTFSSAVGTVETDPSSTSFDLERYGQVHVHVDGKSGADSSSNPLWEIDDITASASYTSVPDSIDAVANRPDWGDTGSIASGQSEFEMNFTWEGDGILGFSSDTGGWGRNDITTQDKTVDLYQNNVNITKIEYFDGIAKESYTNTFAAKHAELETIDNDVVSGLGNSSSGYLSDVFDAYERGEINITETLWDYDKVRQSPEDMEAASTQTLARERLGLGRGAPSTSLTLTVHKGAVVNGQTLDSNTTYGPATIWSTSPPENNTWRSGKTYNVSSVGLAGLNYEATNSYTENGTIHYETVSRMANIESGTFTVETITDTDGNALPTIDHKDNNPESTNVSDLNKQIEDLSEAIELYRDQLENETGGISGPGGTDGSGIDLSIPGLGSISLPFNSLAINLGAIGMVVAAGAVVVFVAGPTGRLISLAWSLSSRGGRAAEKVAGLTDARKRGLERFRER